MTYWPYFWHFAIAAGLIVPAVLHVFFHEVD